LRNGKHHSSIPSRLLFGSNPIEEEKINFERFFANDAVDDESSNNADVDTLDEGIWLNVPVDVGDAFGPSKKRSYKRTLGRNTAVVY
jgi:hypothetical protein